MPLPILRTAHLLLVPLEDRHLDLEIHLDSDAEVLRYITGRAQSSDQVAAAHAQRMASAAPVDGLGYWMTFVAARGERGSPPPEREDDGEFIGLLMLPPAPGPDQPAAPGVAELGYRIVRHHWRKGFASEASRALLRHAFDTIGQNRVIAQTMAVNRGSRGVMESIGMRHVRTHFPVWDDPLPGTDQGEVEYEMTREMWTAPRPRARPTPGRDGRLDPPG